MSGIAIHTSEGSVATVPGSQRALASLTSIQITTRVLGATSPRRIFDLIQDGTLPPEAIDAIAIGESHVDRSPIKGQIRFAGEERPSGS